MITAIDTSVLIAIAKGEPDAVSWVDLLARARPQGELIICDVVAAEFFAVLLDEGKFVDSLTRLGIIFSPTSLEAARLGWRNRQDVPPPGRPTRAPRSRLPDRCPRPAAGRSHRRDRPRFLTTVFPSPADSSATLEGAGPRVSVGSSSLFRTVNSLLGDNLASESWSVVA